MGFSRNVSHMVKSSSLRMKEMQLLKFRVWYMVIICKLRLTIIPYYGVGQRGRLLPAGEISHRWLLSLKWKIFNIDRFMHIILRAMKLLYDMSLKYGDKVALDRHSTNLLHIIISID